MAPRRKRQRLSVDGAEAITAVADHEEISHVRPASKDTARKQLFVRSLAPAVSSDDLTAFFSEDYPIKHALVVLEKETKLSKGYGFVTFADPEDALRAKEELDNTELQGKKIRIEVAESRHRDVDDVSGALALSAGERVRAQREQERKDNQTPKLIVRNLPWSIYTPYDLEKLFRSYGKIHFVKLPKKPSGELRGFGFVALRGRKNAEKAMEEMNGKEIDGRPIAVDWAVDREEWQTLNKGEDEKASDKVEHKKDENTDESSSDEASSSVISDSDSDSEEDDANIDDEGLFDSDEEGGIELEDIKSKAPEYTVFIRNLPFTADDDSLYEHFTQFGRIGYARVVVDHETERPKGTGFVRFVKEEDMVNCLKGIPRTKLKKTTTDRKDGTTVATTHSVLEDQDADPSGAYTMDGRILHISRAVDRSEATRLTAEGAANRFNRDKDKRRLYLLSEGTIDSKSTLYQKLSPSEIKMREESATLRRRQIQENPSLHLSLTRLSVRNIPRSTTSKDLKALARQAVVGFAADAKSSKRQRLSKEELTRGGQAMFEAEKMRKKRGKGIVKQAKVVFETPAGSKIAEDTGAGRSRGYGFIEYYTHRSALMGLRWLNGHAIDYRTKGEEGKPIGKKGAKEVLQDKKKRLIVEFAIENANVVARRSDRESKAKEHPRGNAGSADASADADGSTRHSNQVLSPGKKRRHDSTVDAAQKVSAKQHRKLNDRGSAVEGGIADSATKLKHKMSIIQKKRAMRRARKQGKT